MRPFRMFFGIAVGVILFLFVVRVAFAAFIIAAVMSLIYAMYRRLKDFVTYDRNGDYYIPKYYEHAQMNRNWNNHVEPLFYSSQTKTMRPSINSVQFVEAR